MQQDGNEANSLDVSSTNTRIQHIGNGNKQGATVEKPSFTSCSNTDISTFVFKLQAITPGCDKVLNQDQTPLLYSLVFGERVLNDATSVIFNAVQNFDLLQITTDFAFQLIGNFF